MLDLRFQSLEQGEGIRRRAREARDHMALGEPAHLAGIAFHDGGAKAHLPVSADDDLPAFPHIRMVVACIKAGPFSLIANRLFSPVQLM